MRTPRPQPHPVPVPVPVSTAYLAGSASFDDARFPFTFDYPESWHVAVSAPDGRELSSVRVTSHPPWAFLEKALVSFVAVAVGRWEGGLAEYGTLEAYLQSPARRIEPPIVLHAEQPRAIGGVEAIVRSLSAPAVPERTCRCTSLTAATST